MARCRGRRMATPSTSGQNPQRRHGVAPSGAAKPVRGLHHLLSPCTDLVGYTHASSPQLKRLLAACTPQQKLLLHRSLFGMVCFRIPKFYIGPAGLLVGSTRPGSRCDLTWLPLRACLVSVSCLGLLPVTASTLSPVNSPCYVHPFTVPWFIPSETGCCFARPCSALATQHGHHFEGAACSQSLQKLGCARNLALPAGVASAGNYTAVTSRRNCMRPACGQPRDNTPSSCSECRVARSRLFRRPQRIHRCGEVLFDQDQKTSETI